MEPRAAARDEFEALVQQYGPGAVKIAFQLVGSLEDARDAVQNALVKAWRAYDLSRPQNPRAWLFRIVHNEALNLARHRQTGRRAESTPAPTPDPWTGVQDADLREAIDAMRKLEPPYREILNLRFVAGLPLEDIAAALDLPLGTVKVYAARGLQRLRKFLGVE